MASRKNESTDTLADRRTAAKSSERRRSSSTCAKRSRTPQTEHATPESNSCSADVIQFCQSLVTPKGEHAGNPFQLLSWQRQFIRGTFNPVIRQSALSIARGNGKSALCAALLLYSFTRGKPGSESLCFAGSLLQARIVFDFAMSYAEMLGYDFRTNKREYRCVDTITSAYVKHLKSGRVMRCLSSEPKFAHGRSPSMVICDEPAQWLQTRSDAMYTTLLTSLGKIPGAVLIALGTRPADETHWFSRLLIDTDKSVYRQVHSWRNPAGAKGEFTLAAARAANPSMVYFGELKRTIVDEARRAKRDISLAHAYRALRLNSGTAQVDTAYLCSPETWQKASAKGEAVKPQWRGSCWGVDLGQSAAMSAVACYDPDTGALDAIALFPQTPTLAERGRLDGAGTSYMQMAERNELFTAGECSPDRAALMNIAVTRWGAPSAIACDRWRIDELTDALKQASVPPCPMIVRGQGWRDGAQDVRAFQEALLDGQVLPLPSVLLTAAMSAARTISDAAGNRKLAKHIEGGRHAGARDDAAAAAVLAVAVSVSRKRLRKTARRFLPIRRHAHA